MYRIAWIVAGFVGLCLIFSVISAAGNHNLPVSNNSNRLNALDKARVLEALHLKSYFGDQVWSGFGTAEIPLIIWNDSHEFLVNYKNEAQPGWTKITDDDLNGQVYFHQAANEPQNFAVRVGDVWVASMASKQTTDAFLIQSYQDILPVPFKQIFPYRILLQPSETQLGAVLHEAFHVFQYETAPSRMDEAESIHRLGDQYGTASEQFSSERRNESAILADALNAKTLEQKTELVGQFLSAREARRSAHQMSIELIDYEQWLEWEEGAAKYIELAFLRSAGESTGYQPTPEMNDDPDFKAYQNFDQRWSQEMFQLRYQTTSGESQFYMTGMAQAFLLDDLMTDWKDKYWNEGVFLDDLLRTAITE